MGLLSAVTASAFTLLSSGHEVSPAVPGGVVGHSWRPGGRSRIDALWFGQDLWSNGQHLLPLLSECRPCPCSEPGGWEPLSYLIVR